MAKKKASVKKSNTKKAAKKAVKKTPKKAAKKAIVKKTKKPATPSKKKVAKKTAVKAKSAVKKAPTKTPIKKASRPGATAVKAKAEVPKKSATLDLSDFVTPLDDRLIVQAAGAERQTAGGLYIPDTVADVSGNLQGQVVAVGRGHQNKKGQVRPMDVKLGDKVVFAAFSGTKINIHNQDLIILREGDVLGVVAK